MAMATKAIWLKLMRCRLGCFFAMPTLYQNKESPALCSRKREMAIASGSLAIYNLFTDSPFRTLEDFMPDNWSWAELNDEQMSLLKEAEETLGADIVLAFKAGDGAAMADLKPASLNESQMDCLKGTEEKLGSVLVAYQN